MTTNKMEDELIPAREALEKAKTVLQSYEKFLNNVEGKDSGVFYGHTHALGTAWSDLLNTSDNLSLAKSKKETREIVKDMQMAGANKPM